MNKGLLIEQINRLEKRINDFKYTDEKQAYDIGCMSVLIELVKSGVTELLDKVTDE